MDPSTENGRKVIAYVPREAELECIVQSLNWFVHVSVCFGWVNLNHSVLCLYETRKTKACKKTVMRWVDVKFLPSFPRQLRWLQSTKMKTCLCFTVHIIFVLRCTYLVQLCVICDWLNPLKTTFWKHALSLSLFGYADKVDALVTAVATALWSHLFKEYFSKLNLDMMENVANRL